MPLFGKSKTREAQIQAALKEPAKKKKKKKPVAKRDPDPTGYGGRKPPWIREKDWVAKKSKRKRIGDG